MENMDKNNVTFNQVEDYIFKSYVIDNKSLEEIENLMGIDVLTIIPILTKKLKDIIDRLERDGIKEIARIMLRYLQ